MIATSPVAYTNGRRTGQSRPVVSEGPPLPDFTGQQVSAAQMAAATGGYSINPVQAPASNQPARNHPEPVTQGGDADHAERGRDGLGLAGAARGSRP